MCVDSSSVPSYELETKRLCRIGLEDTEDVVERLAAKEAKSAIEAVALPASTDGQLALQVLLKHVALQGTEEAVSMQAQSDLGRVLDHLPA